jgi:hypothetical protein
VSATETVTRTVLLGVRFWDVAMNRVVSDGLALTDLATGASATVTPGGVFAFHELPGLWGSATGAGDTAFWSSPPERRALTLSLTDVTGRFQPIAFAADAPRSGLLADPCGPAASPPVPGVASVPLFSTPARPVPAGTAVVRADLRDASAGAPAAWAMLMVSAGGRTYRGLAGPDGRVAVLLPYPEPPVITASPPALGGTSALVPLTAQTWQVTVSALYDPAAMAGSPPTETGDVPDLCAVLAQRPATVAATGSPLTPLGPQTLTFGTELVLRTGGGSVLSVFPPTPVSNEGEPDA